MQDPIQLPNDELGCPRCKSELTEGNSSYYFQKVKVGSFDSLRCDFCGYFILSEKGFRESTKKIKQLGLIVEGEDHEQTSTVTLKFFHPDRSETTATSIITTDIEGINPTSGEQRIQPETVLTPLLTSKYKFSKR